MDQRVAFLVRGLQTRFPDASITETLAAASSLLTQPTLRLSHLSRAEAQRQQGPPTSSIIEENDTALDSESEWRAAAAAVLDCAVKSLNSLPSQFSLAQRLEAAALEWQQAQQRGGEEQDAAGGGSGGGSLSGCRAAGFSQRGSSNSTNRNPRRGSPMSSATLSPLDRQHRIHHTANREACLAGSSRGDSAFAVPSAATSPMANNCSLDATPSVVSIDATPEELPVGAQSFRPDSSGGGSTRSRPPVPPIPHFPGHDEVAVSPLDELSLLTSMNAEKLVLRAEESARLAERVCRGVYEGLYEQSVVAMKEVEEDGDNEEEAGEDLPAPLCSLVIECDAVRGGVSLASASLSNLPNSVTDSDAHDRGCSFVVGCSWEQWDYLRHGPLACRCSPCPPSNAPGDERTLWKRRHCYVRLLHPVSDFLQQRTFGNNVNRHSSSNRRHNNDSSNNVDNGDSSSDTLTTTNVEYDLSEGHAVLCSLLGLAMQVWGERDAHLVAQITDLEATQPVHTYHSSAFWASFTQNNQPPLRPEDPASPSRVWHLPTPLLPGEYVDADADDEDEDLIE